MDSKEMTADQVSVKIDRGEEDGENEPVLLVFEELGDLKVALSESTTEDITALFNEVFDYISNKKALVEFNLDDAENDLFNHVSQDIIDQLNAEIRESEESFQKIWQLVPQHEPALDHMASSSSSRTRLTSHPISAAKVR